MAGVLEGLRVLDLSWGIAGPIVGMMLGDHGAEVTKIEPPGGDRFRTNGGYAQAGYRAWQRGKESAILDLKSAADRDAFLALAKHADILIESFSPGTTKNLGIDFATLSAANPRLIYCSITAYGRGTKDEARPGYDALVAARTGLFCEQRGWPEGALNRMAGNPDPYADIEIPYDWVQGPAREGPIFTASRFPSQGAFYNALTGISAALYAREKTGRGQWVETSLMQGAMAAAWGAWQRAEKIDAPLFDTWIFGSRSPKGHFQGSDGRWLHNWVPNPRFIINASAGETLNATPDLSVQNDPDRFGTGPEELVVMSHYQPILAEAVKKFPAKDWVAAAAIAEVTMQEVRPPEEALTDPLFLADRISVPMEDPDLGTLHQVGIVYTLESSPGRIGAPPARAGQHTEAVRKRAAALKDRAPAKSAATGKLKAPLEGIRVLDLGLAIAGPYGTQLLADLGAEVIKVNALYDTYWHRNHIAYVANRGKRSIALNLKDPRAHAILMKLVDSADVVQHNMRYDAAERLGVDYDTLIKRNPKLVYCHTRGHEHGPRQPLPGNDQTGSCLAGNQWEDGGMWRGGKPMWSLTSFGDTGNGFLSAIGIMQALYERERTGKGQRVDTAIVNAQLLNCSYAQARPDGSQIDRPLLDGDQLGTSALHRVYETQEGWLCLVVLTDSEWLALANALGLAGDARFASAASRKANDAALWSLLEEKFRQRKASDWFQALDRAGVPVEVVDFEFGRRLPDNPEFVRRGWVVSYPQHYVGKVDQIGLLIDFSETPGRVQGPPLVVGQHTEELMRELGFSDAEIANLAEEKAIMTWSAAADKGGMPANPWANRKK